MTPHDIKRAALGKLEPRRSRAERFWVKVDIRSDDECWPWLAVADKQGRGRFQYYGAPASMINAQRAAWFFVFGELRSEIHVLHRCDNPACCNPKHLFVGSHQDNMQDKIAKGRHSYGENSGNSCVLTNLQVSEIRALRGVEFAEKTASRYGVSVSHVYAVQNGRARRTL